MSTWLATLRRRLRLEGYLELRTPLHVGVGQSTGATGSDTPVLLGWDDSPVIPGSSFKGALRAQVEALLRGFNPAPDRRIPWSCDVVGENYCIPKGKWDPGQGEKEDAWITRLTTRSCHVCQLFGAPFLAAKLAVSDLAVIPETWHPFLIQVRDGVAIDRDTLTVSGNKKYDFEIVPPGVRFALELVLDNPEEYELGLLFRAFDLFNEGLAFVGGKATRGTGRVRVEVDRIVEIDPARFLRDGAGHVTGVDAKGRAAYLEALKTALMPT